VSDRDISALTPAHVVHDRDARLVHAHCALSIAHAGHRRALRAAERADDDVRQALFAEARRLLQRAMSLRNRVLWLAMAETRASSGDATADFRGLRAA
jgi:hypothetical protein